MAIKIERKIRMAQILEAALAQADKIGYQSLSRKNVADLAGVTPSLIHYYFGSMGKLKKLVMKKAILLEILPILAQGLITRDPIALKAPEDLKQKAASYLIQ